MTDNTYFPAGSRISRLSKHTDDLVRHVAEQAGSDLGDYTRREVDTICDAISEGDAVVHRIGALTCYLTAHLGSAHMVANGVDDLLDLIIDTAKEQDPDAVERSWEPYALTFDGARYAE